MAMSTASVIESIIVMRLCSLDETTMPNVVRFVAFRVIGRVLWIARSSSKHPEDPDANTERQDHPDDQESLHRQHNALSNVAKSSSEHINQVNDILVELRKVSWLWFTMVLLSTLLQYSRE